MRVNAENIIAGLKDPTVPFTMDQIKEAWDLLGVRHKQLQALTARAFAVGDKVSFEGRNGRITGTVTKINQKTVSVSTPIGRWKVSATMLKKEA